MPDEIKGGLAHLLADGAYLDVLNSLPGKAAIEAFSGAVGSEDSWVKAAGSGEMLVAQAALNAFLQINVTGPVLEGVPAFAEDAGRLRKECLRALEVDGVAPYPYVPSLELFSLARHLVVNTPDRTGRVPGMDISLAWLKLRVHVWHYRLLTQPQLGPGSSFTRSSHWSDVPTLVSRVLDAAAELRKEVLEPEVGGEEGAWTPRERVECAVELANCEIMLGRDDKAREGLKEAVALSGFEYALTGALGKKTKFQEESLSQLVVLAKSASEEGVEGGAQPEALPLNDEVLLEKTAFDKVEGNGAKEGADAVVPAGLRDLAPDAQPQLDPLDQIILLTEGTLKDAFSPVDDLTSEEILPYAQRVLSDKSTNWQIYTQALIVRSRVEARRSRTVERGVLQLQAVVDQILVDTAPSAGAGASSAPSIAVTPAWEEAPTSFLPAPKEGESAPVGERLRYVNAIATPPRWHLEAELAYGWAGVGSLISALEIFKRLRLWAEVALCLASATASDGSERSGGEEKAVGIIRWRLFNRTGTDPSASIDADDEDVKDVTRLSGEDWKGPERSPPPNAPRLWCILGDIEDDPAHYARAWEISGKRFARAQRSLAEHYIQRKDFAAARDAYKAAVHVNRFSSEMWSRLGDIHLRLGEAPDAAEAFSRAISAANDVVGGEDARTWSNLGSALYTMYLDSVEAVRKETGANAEEGEEGAAGEEVVENPGKILAQSLDAYKRGAGLARENWQIWDNVLTLASRTVPPSLTDMLLATQNIIRIRRTEEALDAAVLSVLLREGLLMREKEGAVAGEIYEPKRGTPERMVVLLFEDMVAPLITTRSELWELVSRERVWRGDYAGGIEASESAWRAAVTGLRDEEGWGVVVRRTDELVSALENFGEGVEGLGGRWRGKARAAVRSAMGKGRGRWEEGEGWRVLEGLMEGLKREAS